MADASALQLSEPAPKPKLLRSILGFTVTPTLLALVVKRFPAAFAAPCALVITFYHWLSAHYGPSAPLVLGFAVGVIIVFFGIRYWTSIVEASVYLGRFYWWVIRAMLIAVVAVIVLASAVSAWKEPSIHAALVANNCQLITTLAFMLAAVFLGSIIGHGVACFFVFPLTILDIALSIADHVREPDTSLGYSLLVGLAFISTFHLVHFWRDRHK